MFGTREEQLNCGIATLANAAYINSAFPPAALKQAQHLHCAASCLKSSWHLLHAINKYETVTFGC
jgi:hypothetical protein